MKCSSISWEKEVTLNEMSIYNMGEEVTLNKMSIYTIVPPHTFKVGDVSPCPSGRTHLFMCLLLLQLEFIQCVVLYLIINDRFESNLENSVSIQVVITTLDLKLSSLNP